ncbi:MAG: anti-sigma factor antagonist [Clostridia bacterium]|nr:anti-sigma factor antagonist [Clostridia bacterium]
MSADVVFIERQNNLIARIGKEIDHHTAGSIREAIDSRLFYVRPDRLILDFGSVGFMDSSGIALIIGRCEVAAAVGATVRLVGLSPQLMKLARLAGLERIRNLTVSAGED